MKPRIGITSSPTIYDREQLNWQNQHVTGVTRAGGLPLILPTLAPGVAQEMVAELDGLVLIGGGDIGPDRYGEQQVPEVNGVDPERDDWELALIAAAGAGFPVLGICRGLQLLNVAAGGSLIQHLPAVTEALHRQRYRERELVHSVDIAPASQLAEILGSDRLGVNSVHHQSIAEVGRELVAVAWSPDGVIEAVERRDGAPVVAIQWHPEWLIDLPRHGQLYLWLTRAAALRRPGLEVPKSFAYATAEVPLKDAEVPLKDSA